MGVKNIIKKELSRVFTDKKLVISLFILPGVLIMVIYSIMGGLISKLEEDIDTHIPIVYIQNAPEDFKHTIDSIEYIGEIDYLSSSDSTEPVKDGILKGDIDLLVVFDEGFKQTIQDYSQPGDLIPEVRTFYNPSEEYSVAARGEFLSSVLNTYQQNLLVERIDNIELLQVFNIDIDPDKSIIVDESKASGKFLAMLLPFLMNIMLFQGAMGLGMDSITGEKERGTLASMLLSPIKRSEIVLGKLISLGILTGLSAVIYTVSVAIGLQNLSGGMGDIGSIKFTPVQMVQLFVLLIFLVYIYVSMVSLVAVYARTQKEAGTYVTPLYILVMLGSIMTMFSPGGSKETMHYAIPIYNGTITIQDLLVGELTMANFGITIGSLALLAFLITTCITKAFNSERVMFNA
ncbi:MAG: ABC transporter permease [Clostridiales bacterium]|jgi:sodium transport system permease protein|nr:ABC transporter permease subunit [Bacillota bacterium]NLK03986.1 ABC transporter permease [Clostridiales bacterium]